MVREIIRKSKRKRYQKTVGTKKENLEENEGRKKIKKK